MASDSLDYTMYMKIALWLVGRVEPYVKGSAEPSYYPKDMQLPEVEQRLLWNGFFRQDKEAR